MATSQNGWPVISSDLLAPVAVNGVAMVPGVRRSVAPLFQDLCQGLAEIEAPHPGWCWGWAFRPIRGQTSGYSNHASGTAIDWNAPHHPRGGPRHAGFSAVEVGRIHVLLHRYDGVIRWGGDYQNPPFDPMHFEIVGNAEQVRRVMERLTAPKEDDDMALFKDKAEFESAVERAVDHVMSQGLTGDRDGAIRSWASQLDQVKKEQQLVRDALDRLTLKVGGGENPSGALPK